MRSHVRGAHAAWWVLLALAVGVGAWLRAQQLGSQVLIDDEWHALHKLLRADARDIATHFGLADYSIPLTLYYRFLYLHGGLSEWAMRLPMLLSGIALVGAGPWLLRRRASVATLGVWSALIAISPFMIYHSRTARPYAVTTLLVVVALLAFHEWWRAGRRRWAIVYGACTVLAGWLHLITLPFTLLPFIFFGVAALWRGRSEPVAEVGRAVLRLLLLGLCTAALLALVLLPPLLADWSALAGKAGNGAVTFTTIYRGLLLMYGVAGALPFAVLALLTGIGIASWARRDGMFVAYLVFVLLGAGLAITASHAAWLQHQGTWARYLQPAVAFLLLFAAEGFATVTQRLAAPVRAGAGAAFAVALLALGPLPGYAYNPNQFMGDPYFQFDYDPAHNLYRTQLPEPAVPDFYRRLATLPRRTLTLVETPWSLETDRDPLPFYQRVHRQRIRIALTTPVCGVRDYGEYPEDPGLRMRQFTHLSALLRGEQGGDMLVMHFEFWPAMMPAPPQWPDTAQCEAIVERTLGAPQYRDAQVAVFALTPAGTDALRALYPAQRMQ